MLTPYDHTPVATPWIAPRRPWFELGVIPIWDGGLIGMPIHALMDMHSGNLLYAAYSKGSSPAAAAALPTPASGLSA